MQKPIDWVKCVGFYAITTVGVIVAAAIAPAVGLVGIPIFAMKALFNWIKHRSLYKRTLTNGTREKFGRVAGQDYTRLDGSLVDPSQTERLGVYRHGGKSENIFQEDFIETAFNTKEDLEWLNLEFDRRLKKESYQRDLKLLRVSAMALIPVVGLLWCIFIEGAPGGAFAPWSEGFLDDNIYWDWKIAIEHHRQNLQKKSLKPMSKN